MSAIIGLGAALVIMVALPGYWWLALVSAVGGVAHTAYSASQKKAAAAAAAAPGAAPGAAPTPGATPGATPAAPAAPTPPGSGRADKVIEGFGKFAGTVLKIPAMIILTVVALGWALAYSCEDLIPGVIKSGCAGVRSLQNDPNINPPGESEPAAAEKAKQEEDRVLAVRTRLGPEYKEGYTPTKAPVFKGTLPSASAIDQDGPPPVKPFGALVLRPDKKRADGTVAKEDMGQHWCITPAPKVQSRCLPILDTIDGVPQLGDADWRDATNPADPTQQRVCRRAADYACVVEVRLNPQETEPLKVTVEPR